MATVEQRLKALENERELLWGEVRALRERIARQWDMGDRVILLDGDYLKNDAFDGDAFSDVGSHTKIENTSWKLGSDDSAYIIPTNAKMVYARLLIRDSASATTAGLYFALYGSDVAVVPELAVRPSGKGNNTYDCAFGWVRTTEGDIWYKCNASGVNTMDVIIQIHKYMIS